jgi:hypothetical protein
MDISCKSLVRALAAASLAVGAASASAQISASITQRFSLFPSLGGVNYDFTLSFTGATDNNADGIVSFGLGEIPLANITLTAVEVASSASTTWSAPALVVTDLEWQISLTSPSNIDGLVNSNSGFFVSTQQNAINTGGFGIDWQAGGAIGFTPPTTGAATVFLGAILHPFQNTPNGVATTSNGTQVVSAIPEPETYAMMLLGLAAVAGVARKRARRQG